MLTHMHRVVVELRLYRERHIVCIARHSSEAAARAQPATSTASSGLTAHLCLNRSGPYCLRASTQDRQEPTQLRCKRCSDSLLQEHFRNGFRSIVFPDSLKRLKYGSLQVLLTSTEAKALACFAKYRLYFGQHGTGQGSACCPPWQSSGCPEA